LANYISKKTFYEEADRDLVGQMNPGALEFIGATDDDVSAVSDQLRGEYLKSETFMSMIGIGN